ncbi:ligand-binding sensor domain-containing protein [Mariniphaga anaerophila]|uniref:hypothetical protein n=1 Tax=Mariniphaga anaerophila TaxID=1484053 RepID=UPI001114A8E7|nr:hypothetical protein [Mariniphaga anaerophila]
MKQIRLPMYLAKGLEWKGESTQNTTWSKITETSDGKIWFCGGDHWGIDEITGKWDKSDRYERPWGFGNTTLCYYDPMQDQSFEELELNSTSAIYSNEQTPGHGKIHANIVTDSKDRLYFAGYMGYSFIHEYTDAYFPKSYAGGALIKYDPSTKHAEYLGIPVPYGAVAAMYYDEKRDIINGISVDRAKFWRVKVSTMELNRYESVARMSRLKDRVREMIMDNDGYCYFANDVGGLTKFDPDTQEFMDLDIVLPGKLMDFRASVVSSMNTIYGITTDGFVWSFNPNTNELKDLGHIIGMPDQSHYTPNIALDEKWERLYFIAGTHGYGLLEEAFGVLTILDLKTGKYYWAGKIEGFEGCFGALCSKDHEVYFNSFGRFYEGDQIQKDKSGQPITRPYLLKYSPPEDLNELD